VTETTTDRFLGGRITLQQSAHGFRAGLDAVVLAAAVPAMPGDHVLELGAGCGTSSLCLAARVNNCSIIGVEIDHDLVTLASINARQNGMEERVQFIQGDVLGLPRTLKKEFSHVFANPPFHPERHPASPNISRDRAKRDSSMLGDWLRAGLKRVGPKGTLTMIVRADRLLELLPDAPEGGVILFPLWPRAGEAARRAILQVRKGSQSPMLVLPGLVLHEEDGQFTGDADAVLRGISALVMSPQFAA
jgi:tRNA1(Val) A37 N6-methylase TrmN6